MKNTSKNLILGIIIGSFITGTLGVTAITITTKEVTYSPNNPNFKVNNTDDALNHLYKLSDYEIPADTYFYDKNNIGKDIKRYKKINNEYYACDDNGKVTLTKPMSVNANDLVEYKGITSATLNAGYAGYANKNFVLGDGSEIKSTGNKMKKIYLGSGPGNYNVTAYKGYENFTSANFSYDAVGGVDIWNTNYINTGYPRTGSPSISYNNKTGIATVYQPGAISIGDGQTVVNVRGVYLHIVE